MIAGGHLLKLWSWIKRYAVLLAVLAGGLLVLLSSAALLLQQVESTAQHQLEVIAAGQASELEGRLNQQQEVLLGLQAAVTLNPALDRQQFYDLLLQSNVLYRHPSLLAMALVRPIGDTQIQAHIAAARADKRVAPLAYKDYQPGPLTGESPYQILEYLYPINRMTGDLLGQNVLQSLALSETLIRARDTGRLLTSPVFHLPGSEEPMFAYIAPIYRDLPPEPSMDDRRAQHAGSVVALVRLREVMRPLIRGNYDDRLSWHLVDQGYALKTWVRARPASEVMRYEVAPELKITRSTTQLVHLPGRQWQLHYDSHTEFLNEHQNEWLLMALGVALLGLAGLAGLMQYLYSSRHWALQVLEQTKGDQLERQQQVQYLLQAVEHTRDAVVLRQPDGRILYANAAADALFCPPGEKLAGQYQVLLSQSELGELPFPQSFASRHTLPDGELRHLEAYLQPIQNDRLQPVANALFVRDISVEYEQSLSLKKQAQRLQEMLDLSSDWFWEQDAEARFTLVTGGFFTRFDIAPNFFLGKRRWELGTGGLTTAQWDEHRHVLAMHRPYRDFEYTSQLGRETIIVSVSGHPLYGDDGEFLGYRGIGRDVTSVRMAQRALLAEQQRAQATLDSIADGVITTDVFGRVDYINPVASSLVGWELSAARGQPLSAIYQTVDRLSRLPLPDLIDEVLREGGQYHGARRSVLLNKFGLNFQIEECGARIRDEQSHTIGAVLVFRDVSNWRALDDRPEIDY